MYKWGVPACVGEAMYRGVLGSIVRGVCVGGEYRVECVGEEVVGKNVAKDE